MKLPNPYRCDFCPVTKGENNHWYLVFLAPLDFNVAPWSEGPDEGNPKHACSEQCVGKALNQWFEDRRPKCPSHQNLVMTNIEVPEPPLSLGEFPIQNLADEQVGF